MAALTALALGGAAALAGGVGNYLANSSAADRAEALQNKSLQQWLALQIPDPEEQKLALEKFVVQGKLDPKIEGAIKADPSQFQKIVTNTGYQAAQNKALGELEDIGYSGGLRLQDEAALQDATLEGQARDRANRQGIAADMSRRGLGGSGYDVAAQLQGQQATADQMSNQRLKVAAGAQDRALQAIQGAGDLAGKYRTQDFGEQSAKATAADKINLFNTNNLQDVQQRNIAAQNQAQAMNLGQMQKTADQNTQQANYQQEHNKGLLQQQFDNQAKKTAGMSGQYGALAQNATQQGQNLGNAFTNAGNALSGAATTAANYLQQKANPSANNMSLLDEYLKSQKKSGVF